MNVVHIFPYSAKVSGGHSNAIRAFIACQRAGGINAVGISNRPDAGAAQTSVDFPHAEVDSPWSLRWADVIQQFAIGHDDSLLHLHGVNRRSAPLLADLRRAGIPYVLSSHGQLSFRSPWHWFKKYIYLKFVNRGPLRASGLHFLTRYAAHRVNLLLPGYTGVKMVQGNVVTVPNLAGLPVMPRTEFGIPQDALILLFLGRLDVWVKGLDLLVDAFSCLPSERFRLILAGPDWDQGRAKLEQRASALGCRNRVLFTGPVYGEKKWALLRMADLFVSPSRWEAFGIAHAEAMGVGLPLVTTVGMSSAMSLRESDAALLLQPEPKLLANGIAALEADPARRRALGERGQAWAQRNCDPARAADRFQRFYREVLERVYRLSG